MYSFMSCLDFFWWCFPCYWFLQAHGFRDVGVCGRMWEHVGVLE